MKRLFSYNLLLGWYTSQKKGTMAALLVGFIALCWFLIRVVPKPQRAFYPCQRAAFPLATGFLIWIIGLITSVSLFRKSKQAFKQFRIVVGLVLGLAATGLFLASMNPQGMKSFAISVVQSPPEEFKFDKPGIPIMEPVSTVSIIQSDKSYVADITSSEIEDMVREAVSMAGGLGNLINDGHTVVLKPNLLTFRTLPYDNVQTRNLTPGSNGIVTDYRVIQAMVNIIRELNPSGDIILIEGSAVGSTRSNFNIVGWNNVTGLDSVIFLDELCDWQDKNSPALVKAQLPPDKVLYTSGNEHNAYYMSRVYYEADVLISLPCLKNHSNTGITGGIKNVGIGATPIPIYGWGPNDPTIPNERWNPDNGINHGTETNRDPLHNWIHDFYLARPVDFVLMDGLQGIEMGPAGHFGSLSSCQENMRLILASHDPVAIDAIESLICGHNPYRIRYLSTLHRDEAGNMDPRLIRVLGKEVHEVKKKFRIFDSGSLTTYNDFSAPEPIIRSANLTGDILNLDITADEDIAKIEISIDGIKESKQVVDNFNQIEFPLSQTPEFMSHIEVSVYDQFLNCTKIQLGGTGVELFEEDKLQLQCYPNPADNFLTVKMGRELIGAEQVEILDAPGRIVLSFQPKPGDNKVNLDISSLSTGLYILKSQINDQAYTSKFIKNLPQ